MSWLTSMFVRRETPEQRAKWIDDTVAMVGRKVVTQAMEQISHAKRALDIATDTPFTEAWIGASGGINADIANGQWTAVKRSRDLARNYDYARGYLHRLDDIVLGRTGIRCQVRMTKRDGTSAREVNAAIESAWRRFGRRGNCDITGKFSWRDIERLQLWALARDGEFLARLVPGIGPHRFGVQLLQPELLDVNCNRIHAGRRVRMGIELDGANRPVAYWLLAQADGADLIQMGRHVRVPAEQIVHAFMAEEPEQLRGYPWMAAGGRRLWMLKEYEEAAAAASANAAKRFGFFQATVDAAESMNPIVTAVVSEAITAAKAAGKELTAEEQKRLFDAATKYTTTVTGQFDTLPPGYTFEPFKSDYPHVNYGEYTKECKRGFASGVGMSYVTTGNDLESVNYSSAQVGVLDEREHLMTVRDWLAEAWHQRVMAAWLPWAMVVANTDYRIDDADFGRIEILNLGSFTQPFTADYTYGNRVDVGMFTEPVPERWLSFHGLNTAATDRPVIIDLFRVSLNPLGQLAMIGDEVGSYEMAGEALVDSTKSASSALGQFGRILDLG